MFKNFELLTILGPTASGKTELSALLAAHLKSQVISADSRQVYRNMNIGTGKDYGNYFVNGANISYHLIDIVDIGYIYNVYEFKHDFITIYKHLREKKILPILCGGTGLYLESVLSDYRLIKVPYNKQLRQELDKISLENLIKKLKDLKPLHNTTDTTDKNRLIKAIELEMYYLDNPLMVGNTIKVNSLTVGIKFERETLKQRITNRLKERLNDGMVEEVKNILKKGTSPDQLIYYGLEYKYVTQYIEEKLTYAEMFFELNRAIHKFAKRQMTWFRRMERKGINIKWIDGELSNKEKVNLIVNDFLKPCKLG